MDTRGDAVENEGERPQVKPYHVSLLMMMSVIPFVASSFQVFQTFQWNMRVSDKSFPKEKYPEEYFSCVDETSNYYAVRKYRNYNNNNNNSCCHMDTESLMTLNVIYEYDGHETRDYQYFHTVFGLSGMIIVFGVVLLIFCNTIQDNQREDPHQIASLTCYLFLGWILHILNCILFFVSVTRLIPKNPLVSYVCGTSEFGIKSPVHHSNIKKGTTLLHCLTEIGTCPNYQAINVYLYIMLGELLLYFIYLPASIGIRYWTENPEQAGGHNENVETSLEPIRRETSLVQNALNLNPSKRYH